MDHMMVVLMYNYTLLVTSSVITIMYKYVMNSLFREFLSTGFLYKYARSY